MSKKRNFLFGYQMIDGQIDLNIKESLVVWFIFKKYSEGISVPKITEQIQDFNVPYREGSAWNKNMVCRILYNETYLGNDEYPSIIEQELFEAVLSQRSIIQSGRLNPTIKVVREKLCCAKCSQKLIRSTHHNRKNMVWICPNCGMQTATIADDELLERIIGAMNFIIVHPTQVMQTSKTVECLSLEAMRLTNEINRKMNDPYTSPNYLLEIIKKCAQEKYNALQNQPVCWQNELLEKALSSCDPLDSLNIQLFQEIINKVFIASDTTVTLQLINRKVI